MPLKTGPLTNVGFLSSGLFYLFIYFLTKRKQKRKRKREREGRREGGKEGRREGGKEGGREGGREGELNKLFTQEDPHLMTVEGGL